MENTKKYRIIRAARWTVDGYYIFVKGDAYSGPYEYFGSQRHGRHYRGWGWDSRVCRDEVVEPEAENITDNVGLRRPDTTEAEAESATKNNYGH